MLSAAAVTTTSRVPTRTFEELSQKADALALRVGTRVTASAVLLGCVLVILVGAQSLLSTMQEMDRDIKEMNRQLAIANGGLDVLNTTMDSLPPTSRHLKAVLGSVEATGGEVETSAASIGALAKSTETLNSRIGNIAGSTTDMRGSMEEVSTGTTELGSTVSSLNTKLDPLVKTQHGMFLQARKMRGGLTAMNDSLAYTIRILNYIAAPPSGQGMMIRADLPKQTLPPIPGIKAETEPIQVFPRMVWPLYTGP